MTSAPTSAATLLSASGIDATDDDFDFAFAGDLVSASASVDENFIATFSVRYTMESFNPERTAPTLLIDIDDNPATGASGVDSADNDAALIGPDYAISAIPAESATDAEAMVFDTDGTILGRVRLPGLVTTRDNGYDITIELSRLQDSDGEFTFAVLSQRQFDATGNSPINDYLPDVGSPKLATSRGLVASVLPASRSVQTGATATAFATIINAGRSTGIDCGLALDSDVDADFSYQTTDPLTNQSTGAPDTPTIVEPNAVQTFVLRVTPRSTRTPSDLTIRFRCANLPEAVPVNGVNTLFLAAEDTAGPDVIALALAPSGDGVVRVPAAPELGFFTLASANVGASGALTFTVDTGAVELPVSFLLCETDPLTAACINPTTPSADPVQVNIDNQGTPTFAVFVEASGTVTFDPAAFRVNARFRDSSGAIRGSTSVAITAAGPPQRILTFDAEIPGTLPTETGTGSGFPTRLPGTGTNYTGNDPNLTLDTVASELRVRSTKSDLNGEANLPAAVFPGIALSELGFTGEENFEVTAHFAGVPLSEIADQFGVYVGASGTQAVRGGYIFFSDQFGLEFYSVQTIDGLDTQLMRFTGASDVENVVNLRRTNGVYQLFINTAEVPMAQPLHLNGRSDLHVGIYASSPGSDNPIELRLLDFGARVF